MNVKFNLNDFDDIRQYCSKKIFPKIMSLACTSKFCVDLELLLIEMRLKAVEIICAVFVEAVRGVPRGG